MIMEQLGYPSNRTAQERNKVVAIDSQRRQSCCTQAYLLSPVLTLQLRP